MPMPLQRSMTEANGQAAFAAGWPEQVPVTQTLRTLVLGILGPRAPAAPFSDDTTLAEIGVASIDMVTLLLAVESEFNVEVPPHEITADVFRSLATLDALIRRLSPALSAG